MGQKRLQADVSGFTTSFAMIDLRGFWFMCREGSRERCLQTLLPVGFYTARK